MLATTRAIVVFPVPGGPVKIMCLDACATFMPRAARTFAICVAARYASICSLTRLSPICRSNSACASASSFSRPELSASTLDGSHGSLREAIFSAVVVTSR